MFYYLLKRSPVIPIALSVTIVCFSLVYIAPGDRCRRSCPPTLRSNLIDKLRRTTAWTAIPCSTRIWRPRGAGDLGTSIATGARQRRTRPRHFQHAILHCRLAHRLLARLAFVPSRYRRAPGSTRVTALRWRRVVPHYWLGMVVIVFSVYYNVLRPWAGPSGDWMWTSST